MCVTVLFSGCRKTPRSSAPPADAKVDACTLITKDEIGAIQGSAVTDTKSSVQANQGFRVAQCFYTASDFSKSVVVNVTRRDPDNPGKRTTREFWEQTFGENAEHRTEREKGREEEEKTAPPKKIDGVGDEAYWTGMRFGAALYVLKQETLLRISIGGGDDEESRLNKTKALALKALNRL